MIEPASFYANPETMETNVYQVADDAPKEAIFARALEEFRNFHSALLEEGVMITTVKGYKDCPDMVFPNCISTHRAGRMFIYPMLNKNRQEERSPEMIHMLSKAYRDVQDWTHFEADGRALESTASIVSDRANKIGYSALSSRTDCELVEKWCDFVDYEAVTFDTHSHAGKPVYHTDCVMWIGSTLAGICAEAIDEKDRTRVLERLKSTHEVVEFTMDQLSSFCGNALEVRGAGNRPMLAMSEKAYKALSSEQKKLILEHFKKIIHVPLDTLEKYGGGSARCMLMELF